MKTIELPRALEDYFAFAEVERRSDARRFCITLMYFDPPRLDRLQWWWGIGTAEEALLGEAGCAARRQREIERFKRHIERWLTNTAQRLQGDGPIPHIVRSVASGVAPAQTELPPAQSAASAAESPADSVVVRRAAG